LAETTFKSFAFSNDGKLGPLNPMVKIIRLVVST
jgi:hypothetical protein